MTTNIATSKERLQEYLDRMGIPTSVFYRTTGLSRGLMDSDKLHQSLSTDKVATIIAAYPDLSLEWLITGEGSMLRSEDGIRFEETIQRAPVRLHRISGKSRDTVVSEQSVPLYGVEATAGIMAQGDMSDYIIDHISIPHMPKVDGALVVTGDSMYPIIKSGDIVLYKVFQDFRHIIYGQMYLVSVSMEGDTLVLVKYVYKVEGAEDFILLVSENKHHEPFKVPLTSVRSLALIKGSIRYHVM